MTTEQQEINFDVDARYELCKKCLKGCKRPGGSHAMYVIAKRQALLDNESKWLNPFYLEKHAGLEQPFTDNTCDFCPYQDEHEAHKLASKLT